MNQYPSYGLHRNSLRNHTTLPVRLIGWIVLGVALFCAAQAHSANPACDPDGPDRMNGPWLEQPLPRTEPEPEANGFTIDILSGAVWVYQTAIGPAISRGCPCEPSCSRYMVQAVMQYGLVPGYILGLERLLHETGELIHGTSIRTRDGFKVADPLENNVFWIDQHP